MDRGARSVGVVLAMGLMLAAASPARGLVWSVQQTPMTDPTGVSCVSARACTAVGGGAMGWDGRRWRREAAPGSEPADSSLAGVSCTSTKLCIAVGEYQQSAFYDPNAMKTVPVFMPLAERWNGVGWEVLPFPSWPPGGQTGDLRAVSCTSGRACMVVGRSFDGGGQEALVAERWDGSTWSLESMPAPLSFGNTLGPEGMFITGLSCSSSSFCTAVGIYNLDDSPAILPFAERWDGHRWSVESSPELASTDTELNGVSCTSSRACVAVGEYFPFLARPVSRTLAERWIGTSWSILRTPNTRRRVNELDSVSCVSSRACMAVGTTPVPGRFQPLVDRWNGTRWSLEPTPGPVVVGAVGVWLQAVSCTSSAICTAVGSWSARGGVAEQSALATAQLTGAPVRCASAPLRITVTGDAISSVKWSLDGRKIKGHTLRPATRYAASIRISPGTHKVKIRVKFQASSETHARTFHRTVVGCSPGR
jgi:hypothetical protein